MNADLELYKIFYTVAGCENISQAAERLYISQPAVSKSIKKLESVVGIALFSRNSRGVKLTEEGKVLYDYVEKAMKQIILGENIVAKLKQKEYGEIKLGVSSTLCKYILIPNLKPFMDMYPNIKIKIINKTTIETLKLVEEGEIDFAIVSRPFDSSSFDFIKLAEIQDIFVAGKGYIETLDIHHPGEIFSKANVMLLESGNITRKYIDKFFQQNNIQLKPEIEISNMDFLIEFAKAGLGITSVIKNFVEKELNEGDLIEIPLEAAIPKRTIGIIHHKKIPLTIASHTFIAYIKDRINDTL
ncbi:MAG: LysR family transcriptional regulator [Bacillota bacterium]|nr:LysR family transcriptional regulator [Bacillota bacterium]